MDFSERWRIQDTVDYLVSNNYKIIAAQFPDEHLEDCVLVVEALEQCLKQHNHDTKIHILADSACDQLTVDVIGAEHVHADCLIHYGDASLTSTSTLSTFFVFPKQCISVQSFSEFMKNAPLQNADSNKSFVVFLDPSLQDMQPTFSAAALSHDINISFAAFDTESRPSDRSFEEDSIHTACGYHWTKDETSSFLWIGPIHSEILFQLQLHLALHDWFVLDSSSSTSQKGLVPSVQSMLRKRTYLIEKAKQAQIVGILISSATETRTLSIHQQIKKLAEEAGKHTYEIVVAQPTLSKLANFPEIDVFVYLCDPTAMILDTKEFLAPMITPYEAEVAFTDSYLTHQQYRYYPTIPVEDAAKECCSESLTESRSREQRLVVRQDMSLAANIGQSSFSASDYYRTKREYHGLEKQTDPKSSEVLKGRTGPFNRVISELSRPCDSSLMTTGDVTASCS